MEPIVLPAGIRQAVSSLEGFFSCTISPFEDQAEPSKRECSSCRISSNRSSVSIPASLCGGRYGFIWSFPEDHPVSAELAEHIQFCSRALIAAMEKPSAGEDNRFFRQVAEILGRGEERGVLILDTQDNTIYQNRTARGRTILKRFLDYQAQSGDASLTSISPVSLLLEGSAPVRISLHNLYCGNRFSGRLVIAEPAGSLPIEKKEGRRHILRGFNGTIGSNRLLVKSIAIARKAAATESTILLRGESGTGKEKFARAIHDLSNRRGFPFAAINCAAIPESLLESELFGYEGGSFTGAKTDGKAGKIEAAHHGTIFLDEIGDMPQTLQAKLLRVLQDREFERVGSTKPVSVDVRFISATHQNLETLMEEGRFRKDLFYRLNVIPLFIPPLRERKDDIAYLLSYFLKKYVIQNPRSGFKYFLIEPVWN